MKVSLAAQSLSSSVADTIDFLRDVMKMTDFANSEATSEFIRIIDRAFDYTNSHNPFEKGYKAPLSLNNRCQWQAVFCETSLLSCSVEG